MEVCKTYVCKTKELACSSYRAAHVPCGKEVVMNYDSSAISSNIEEAVRVLKQKKVIDSFFVNGDDLWTVICDNWNRGDGFFGGQFIALSQPELRERVIRDASWDIRKGEGIPGFVDDGTEVSYFRSASLQEFEPLVVLQNFFGVVPDELNISEDFRFLMRLWRDPKSGNYYTIQESGDKDLAIRIAGQKIEVRTRLLKRYLAARQLDAVLYLDSNVTVEYDRNIQDLNHIDCESASIEHLTCLSRNVWKASACKSRVSSRVLAKRILKAPPREKCGIWPWDEVGADEYPEFIISENEFGEPVRWTCNPENLRNCYGENPDVPHYLTPVFFKPDVLGRYYDGDDYEVRDGYLSCGKLWGVSLDNDCLGYVAVFLGDIGRDIPQGHWDHWKAYNIAPIDGMSEAAIRRSFFNQGVESRNPEHRFKRAYLDLQDKWEGAWGWRLHRQAEGPDAGVFSRLRIPVNETEAEFRSQSLNLALVLVDPLNEKCLTQGLGRVPDEKGIDKLKRFLENNEYGYVERDIPLLRKVQKMRSRIAAHASGSKGRALLGMELGDRSHREYFVELVEELTQMLLDLKRFAASHTSVSDRSRSR